MDDPVSWLLIRPGWKVFASDGAEVGEVDEVTGDEGDDIFDGLAMATTAFGKPRYVPAEQVGRITREAVHLTLTREQVEGLGEFLEPATSEQIEPDSKRGIGESVSAELREVEGKVLSPVQRHEHPVNVWERIALFLRRRRS